MGISSSSALNPDERLAYYQALQHLDPHQQLVLIDPHVDTLSYASAVHCVEGIGGPPGDEELVRALILVHLVHTYSYPVDWIALETRTAISKGVTKREADICIYKNSDDRDKERNVDILCEVKSPQRYSAEKEKAIEKQLYTPFEEAVRFSSCRYLAYLTFDVPQNKSHNALRCLGIDTQKNKDYGAFVSGGGVPDFIDFPTSGTAPSAFTGFVKGSTKDLDPSFDVKRLRKSWSSIWDQIWAGTVEDNAKFENFNKLVLAKIFDERTATNGEAYGFQTKTIAGKIQSAEQVAFDVELLYRKAFLTYIGRDASAPLSSVPGIDRSKLSSNVIAFCVNELAQYSFVGNRLQNVDILGEFYELVIREAFKQTKGLFLTHPNIVLFLISVLRLEDVIDEKLLKGNGDPRFRLPFLIDPSCGTGTFLIFVMRYIQSYLEREATRLKKSGNNDLVDFLERHVEGIHRYKWARDYIYGIDREPMLAVATQINLILHGDGSTNIYANSGLAPWHLYSQNTIPGATNLLASTPKGATEYYPRETLGQFDVLISNPPFSAPVDLDASTLDQTFSRHSTSEGMFLERWYQLLKPHGRLACVLPESLFSVAENEPDRIFLYQHFNLQAIVSLPAHTFSPHTLTSTCLLIAQKKSIDEEVAFRARWTSGEREYEEASARILGLFPRKPDVTFDGTDFSKKDVVQVRARAELDAKHLLGAERVILAFRPEADIRDPDNYPRLREDLRNLLRDARNGWCLERCLTELKDVNAEFLNLAVDEVGYKNGKKGSKDRQNDLIRLVNPQTKSVIFNVKKAEDSFEIQTAAADTALGIARKRIVWQ